jgi:hypothetical protein
VSETASVDVRNQGKYYSECVKIRGLFQNSEQRQMEDVVTMSFYLNFADYNVYGTPLTIRRDIEMLTCTGIDRAVQEHVWSLQHTSSTATLNQFIILAFFHNKSWHEC